MSSKREANTPRVSFYPGNGGASLPLPCRCQHRCSRVNTKYLSTESKSSGEPPCAATQIEHGSFAECQFLAIAVIIRPPILYVVELHKVGVIEQSGLHLRNRNSCIPPVQMSLVFAGAQLCTLFSAPGAAGRTFPAPSISSGAGPDRHPRARLT